MELTRERAIELHRQMWSDMKRDLGDTPSFLSRTVYKSRWCEKHGFVVINDCFLCEYMGNLRLDCSHCPIEWPGGCCDLGRVTYCYSPISEVLALPEREE